MSSTYGREGPNKRSAFGGLQAVPKGAHLLSVEAKAGYENIPFHAYHPSPHDAVTILRSKTNPHEWLVCGWYIDTLRGERGAVKGLVYKQVVEQADKEAILIELKRHDKEANARFVI